ncbi:MAG TPA: PQ-loop repeat-containing protein [Actinomycetota bacterium]|nr:PQ-loop repeat-containing protein [Actinomycetota bacterium]
MLELVGVAGIGISVAAYVPQIVHMWREHCAGGVSTRAWGMWLMSGALLGAVALQRGDAVFLLLQITTLTSSIVTLLLAKKFRGSDCGSHASLSVVMARGDEHGLRSE